MISKGVLTETTAELAASLSLAAAKRIVEADEFMRAGLYDGWLLHLFVGNLLKGQTVGVIGAGRIESAYARMMIEGFKMNLIYYDLYQSTRLEKFVTAYGEFLKSNGEAHVTWKRASSMEEVLIEADVISLHLILDKTTYHLINKNSLAKMKKEAILINCSRGPVVDEVALVEHLKENPMFRVGLDVFEDEPYMKPGLADADMKNAVVVPHIASASKYYPISGNGVGQMGSERTPWLVPKDEDLLSLGSSYDSVSNDEADIEEWFIAAKELGGEDNGSPRLVCLVCFDTPRDCFFLPCGHSATCFPCGSRIAEDEAGTCPLCHRKMKKVRRIITV